MSARGVTVAAAVSARVAGGLTVRRFDMRDAARWDDFVRSAVDATIFHLSAFGDVLEPELGEDLLGVLAALRRRAIQIARGAAHPHRVVDHLDVAEGGMAHRTG
jgi:hypothetical protein